MKYHCILRLMVLLALAALACAPALRVSGAQEYASEAESGVTFAERLDLQGVPNAAKVSDALYRGAQPSEAGYKQLQRLGISTVVDLRLSPLEQSGEKRSIEALGMRHVGIPISGYFGPRDEQVATFLKLLRDNPKEKVFVHCYYGDDRTGAMVAAYRIAVEHWTADQAYYEMRIFHFHRYLIFISRYIKAFPENFQRNPVFASLRSPQPPA